MLNTSSIRGGSSSTGYRRGRHQRATALASLGFQVHAKCKCSVSWVIPEKTMQGFPDERNPGNTRDT